MVSRSTTWTRSCHDSRLRGTRNLPGFRCVQPTIEFLRSHRLPVRLATYDERQQAAARKMGIDLYPL